MKKNHIAYWLSTGVFGLMMAFSAYSYLTQETMRQAFIHLGLPNWFRVELALAKLLGVVVLLAALPPRLKELAYTGFALTFLPAFIAPRWPVTRWACN